MEMGRNFGLGPKEDSEGFYDDSDSTPQTDISEYKNQLYKCQRAISKVNHQSTQIISCRTEAAELSTEAENGFVNADLSRTIIPSSPLPASSSTSMSESTPNISTTTSVTTTSTTSPATFENEESAERFQCMFKTFNNVTNDAIYHCNKFNERAPTISEHITATTPTATTTVSSFLPKNEQSLRHCAIDLKFIAHHNNKNVEKPKLVTEFNLSLTRESKAAHGAAEAAATPTETSADAAGTLIRKLSEFLIEADSKKGDFGRNDWHEFIEQDIIQRASKGLEGIHNANQMTDGGLNNKLNACLTTTPSLLVCNDVGLVVRGDDAAAFQRLHDDWPDPPQQNVFEEILCYLRTRISNSVTTSVAYHNSNINNGSYYNNNNSSNSNYYNSDNNVGNFDDMHISNHNVTSHRILPLGNHDQQQPPDNGSSMALSSNGWLSTLSSYLLNSTNTTNDFDLFGIEFSDNSHNYNLSETMFFGSNADIANATSSPSLSENLFNFSTSSSSVSSSSANYTFGNLYVLGNNDTDVGMGHRGYDWMFLVVFFFIFAGGLGNILVCLAVALDRKLQNVTNYFLFSLAIADLLVSLFVMPLGAIPAFLGYWPLGFTWCNIFVTCDVLACSSSILHMCFISLGRYLGIRNPLGSRHRSTKRLAGIKIAIVWVMAMMVSSSITVLGLVNQKNIMPKPDVCVINNRAFFVFGSLVAFYIPMLMMVTTYALTITLLRKKARFAAEHPESELFRRLGGRFTIRPQHSQQQLQMQSSFTSNSYNKYCATIGDHHRPTVSHCDKEHENEQRHNQTSGCIGNFSLRKSLSNYSNGQRQATSSVRIKSPPAEALMKSSQSTQSGSFWRIHGGNPNLIDSHPNRRASVRSSISQPHLGYPANGKNSSSGTSLRSSLRKNVRGSCDTESSNTSSKMICDTSCSESDYNDAQARNNKMGLFRLPFTKVTTPTLNLRFLNNRNKRNNLSANAVATEQKATKVLGLVFFTFVLCWSPFFILNIIFAACPECKVPEYVVNTCLWLGYASSTINPIIYTIFNRIFRAAFIRLLKCNCERSGRPLRFRSVTEGRSALSLCAPSALPLAISFQGTPLMSSTALSSACTTNATPLSEFRSSYTITDEEC